MEESTDLERGVEINEEDYQGGTLQEPQDQDMGSETALSAHDRETLPMNSQQHHCLN